MHLHLITAEDPLTLQARSRELIRMPQLINDDDPSEEPFCVLNRFDQQDEEEFICFAHVSKIE